MPYSEYIDTKTGNHITAIQAGHGGTLLGEQKDFNEGDWVVKFPLDLMGEYTRDVFTTNNFKKRFNKMGAIVKKKKMTMAELAEMYPPKVKKTRRRR